MYNKALGEAIKRKKRLRNTVLKYSVCVPLSFSWASHTRMGIIIYGYNNGYHNVITMLDCFFFFFSAMFSP